MLREIVDISTIFLNDTHLNKNKTSHFLRFEAKSATNLLTDDLLINS